MLPITSALVAEHRMLCALFDHIDEQLPTLSTLAEIRRFVEGLLRNHAEVEEDLLLLATQYLNDDGIRNGGLRQEHQEIDANLTQVYRADKTEGAKELLGAALAASRRHFEREERAVFPPLSVLSPSFKLCFLGHPP